MPDGFIGNAAHRYLREVSAAHAKASGALQGTLPAGAPSMPRPRPLPFSSDNAQSGRFSVGGGSSNNIVVGQDEYESVARTLCRIDEQIGECLYQCATEIDEMCETIFIMPTVGPRCKNISDSVVRCLGQLRSLTEDVALNARKFAQDINDIG